MAVIVVGFHEQSFYPGCFAAIGRQTYLHRLVIFVNNSPGDASEPMVKGLFPDALILSPGRNTGYAGGNNLGLQAALKAGAQFAFLINPDVTLDPDCLEALVEEAGKFPRPALFQPLLRNPDGTIQTSGNFFQYLGFGSCNTESPPGIGNTTVPIATPSGAALFFDLRIVQRIGPLNGDLFCYQEDMEFALRARVSGFSSYLVPRAGAIHAHDFSGRKGQKVFFLERNRWFVIAAFYPFSLILALLPLLIAAEMGVLAWAAVQGRLGEKLLSYFGVLAMLPRIRAHRRSLGHLSSLPAAILKEVVSWEVKTPAPQGMMMDWANLLSRICFPYALWVWPTRTVREKGLAGFHPGQPAPTSSPRREDGGTPDHPIPCGKSD